MTATEELRRLLDEAGIEWEGREDIHTDFTFWCGVHACETGPKPSLAVYHLTPEQAIAATLGRGMLTADDVRDLIERHSDASGGNGRDFHNGAYVAIADELNATLGAGTCHNISKIVDKYGQARFACSECGAWIDSRMLWNPEYRNGESPWVNDCKLNYCPNCGRRIVDPTTNDADAEVVP